MLAVLASILKLTISATDGCSAGWTPLGSHGDTNFYAAGR